LTAFLSTYLNRVDRKGRVSVPAAYRGALAGGGFQGIIAYPSMTDATIEAFGRDMLVQMSQRRTDQSIEGGDFEQLLLGGGDGLVETVMAMCHELPFDGEGRVILPPALAEHAGITDRATFVGRGSRFQIWQPEAFESHQSAMIERLRDRLGGDQS
jgi:MraZ protein